MDSREREGGAVATTARLASWSHLLCVAGPVIELESPVVAGPVMEEMIGRQHRMLRTAEGSVCVCVCVCSEQ
jgi:hypothetical protein